MHACDDMVVFCACCAALLCHVGCFSEAPRGPFCSRMLMSVSVPLGNRRRIRVYRAQICEHAVTVMAAGADVVESRVVVMMMAEAVATAAM